MNKIFEYENLEINPFSDLGKILAVITWTINFLSGLRNPAELTRSIKLVQLV